MHKIKRKQVVSFAVIISVDVKKPCTNNETKKVGEWLAKYLDVDDSAYELAPVAIRFNKHPIRVRVCECFN